MISASATFVLATVPALSTLAAPDRVEDRHETPRLETAPEADRSDFP